MIQVRRLKNWDEARAFQGQWNSMVSDPVGHKGGLGVPSVFQTFEWNEAWWNAFGKGHELLLLAAFRADELVAVAPLMITQTWFPLPAKKIRMIGCSNFATDFAGLIYSPEGGVFVSAFSAWLNQNPGLWTDLELSNLIEGSPELRIFQEGFSTGFFRSYSAYYSDAPTRELGEEKEDQEVLNKKSLKRHTNWFKAQGDLTFRHLDTQEEMLGRLDLFFEQHIGRRSITQAPSQFKFENQRQFYRSLVKQMAPQGWLRFFEVSLDGKPIAFHIGFEFAKKYYWYKPTFDVKYSKKSPGEVLLKGLMQYAVDRKLSEFDFTVGNESFKYRFSNRIRRLHQLRAFRSPVLYFFFWSNLKVRELLRPMKRRLLSVVRKEVEQA